MTGLRLNIACGANMFFPPWINIDKVDMRSYLDACRSMAGGPEWQVRFVKRIQSGESVDFRVHDVRKGLPFDSETADVIYAGQFIEHLNPLTEAPAFVRECRRVLKPGGVLRMTTPDVDLILEYYHEDRMDDFASEQPEVYKNAIAQSTKLGYLMFGSLGPASTAENYEGHMMIYGKLAMLELLEKAGFKEIFFPASIGGYLGKEVTDMGMSHSMVVEAVK